MVRPTIGNLVTVTALALVGIVGLKWLMNTFPIPGLADVVRAA
jgi:hypothetical protein